VKARPAAPSFQEASDSLIYPGGQTAYGRRDDGHVSSATSTTTSALWTYGDGWLEDVTPIRRDRHPLVPGDVPRPRHSLEANGRIVRELKERSMGLNGGR